MRSAIFLMTSLAMFGAATNAERVRLAAATASASGALDPNMVLKLHNDLRKPLGVPSLAWSTILAADAAKWAAHLVQAGRFDHGAPEVVAGAEGENLWEGEGEYAGDAFFQNWAGERRNFVNGIFPAVSRTGRWSDVGHYTQLIWHDTQAVGCARAGTVRRMIVVCRYSPPANVEGEKALP